MSECSDSRAMTRRKFLLAAAAGAAGLSAWQLLPALAQNPAGSAKKILVTVQLSGGNDGLNMIVPYADGRYQQARPQLAVPADQVLALDSRVGLNPRMGALHSIYTNGKLAVIQAVGYPEPNRSHFRSVEIWQTAQPNIIGDTGWMGRYLDHVADSRTLFPALNLDAGMPKTLFGAKTIVPSVANVDDFVFRTEPRFQSDRQAQLAAFKDIFSSAQWKSKERPYVELIRDAGLDAIKGSDQVQALVRRYRGSQHYPPGPFGNQMKFVAQMIAGGLGATAYNLSLDGFDTHSNQQRQQDQLLEQLSGALSAFMADLDEHGLSKQVVVMVFSEFGRRVAENGGRGTDHGAAAPVMVLGECIKGGVFGDPPSLSDLDAGDLKYKIDFRCIYATLLDRWFNADSKTILQANFDRLGFV